MEKRIVGWKERGARNRQLEINSGRETGRVEREQEEEEEVDAGGEEEEVEEGDAERHSRRGGGKTEKLAVEKEVLKGKQEEEGEVVAEEEGEEVKEEAVQEDIAGKGEGKQGSWQ